MHDEKRASSTSGRVGARVVVVVAYVPTRRSLAIPLERLRRIVAKNVRVSAPRREYVLHIVFATLSDQPPVVAVFTGGRRMLPRLTNVTWAV